MERNARAEKLDIFGDEGIGFVVGGIDISGVDIAGSVGSIEIVLHEEVVQFGCRMGQEDMDEPF
jgi:hypothetical protein